MTTVISAAAPRDLLAYAWFVMGFRPRESLVLVGLNGSRMQAGLVGRVDLPAPRSAVAAADVLADMLDRNGDDGCLLVVVSDVDGGPAGRADRGEMPHAGLVDRLVPALCDRGLHVVDVLLVGPETFRSYRCDDLACCPPQGEPLALLDASPVSAAMVVQGRRVRSEEADLVADVDPVAAAARGEATIVLPRGRPGRGRRRAAFERWLGDLADGAAEPAQPAELLAAVAADLQTRDAVLFSLVPGGLAAAHTLVEGRRLPADADWGADGTPDPVLVEAGDRLLAVLARRAPAGLRAEPLAILGWLAWWSGDAVRGRLLADLALADQPGHRLAGLVAALLAGPVPPPWTRAGRACDVGRPDAAYG
jgi:hypothetical protein